MRERKSNSESGFATIMVLVLAAILIVLFTMAFKLTYSVHKQNRIDKESLKKRAADIVIIP